MFSYIYIFFKHSKTVKWFASRQVKVHISLHKMQRFCLHSWKAQKKYKYCMDPPKPQQTTHPMFTVIKGKSSWLFFRLTNQIKFQCAGWSRSETTECAVKRGITQYPTFIPVQYCATSIALFIYHKKSPIFSWMVEKAAKLKIYIEKRHSCYPIYCICVALAYTSTIFYFTVTCQGELLHHMTIYIQKYFWYSIIFE